jgi:DNA polymerase
MDWYAKLDQCNNLEELESNMQGCRKCSLYKKAKQIVFSKGSRNAPVMIVGEAPGADEDDQGIPFVGKAGQLLDRILKSAGISDIYVTNVVKCRPPENRLPKKDEIDACAPYLSRQIELLQPSVIVCLGAVAAQRLIHSQTKVTMVHGKVYTKGGIKLIPTFHPAALLRDQNKKKPCWDDFKIIRAICDSIKERAVAVG